MCTALAIRDYFLEGKLPEPGTICKSDVDLFSGTTGWDELVLELPPAQGSAF